MKQSLLTLLMVLTALVARAIPADPGTIIVQQPGGPLELKLIGDEFYHFNTTADGFTVMLDNNGHYQYARQQGGQLVLSGIIAHDRAFRTVAENTFLATIRPYLTDERQMARSKDFRHRAQGGGLHAPALDTSKFRGLIVLINYSDKTFRMSNPKSFYNEMVNKQNFTGFNWNGRFQSCTGSMRDYFSYQSNGAFEPEFDVVGPVTVDYSCTSAQGSGNAAPIFIDALNKLDNQVDFSHYDSDNDGVIDMVYFIVAGYAASYSGNDGNYLWPHKYYLWNNSYYDVQHDGKTFWVYACSTETYGWESNGSTMPLGIGTMCHEFSHVLGFPDLYDTNYATNGQSNHPAGWDVMAGGGSYNYGRTPCAYTIWERYAMGWAEPVELNSAGQYAMSYVGDSNTGFILRTNRPGEFFMLDNRQNVKWDAYLPGHGMIVARIDSTDTERWRNNTLNADASHNYYELLRAGNGTGATASDPFPGSVGVTRISNNTIPSLKTWSGIPSDWSISDIQEVNGVVTFALSQAGDLQRKVEDFEAMNATTAATQRGNYAVWNFVKANVEANSDNHGKGNRVTSIVSGGRIEMATDVECDPYMVELFVKNSTNAQAKFKLYKSEDGGNTWVEEGDVQQVNANSEEVLSWIFASSFKPVRYRVNMTAGSKTKSCYIDDFTIHYEGVFNALAADPCDVNGDGSVDVNDINNVINVLLGKAINPAADVTGDGSVDVGDVNAIINAMLNN